MHNYKYYINSATGFFIVKQMFFFSRKATTGVFSVALYRKNCTVNILI